MSFCRFVAVFWSLQYHSKASQRQAIFICVSAKLLSLDLSLWTRAYNDNYLMCEEYFAFFYTRELNLVYLCYLQICVTLLVGMVSSYLGYKIVNMKKSDIRTVSLQPLPDNKINTNTERVYNIRRKNREPFTFHWVMQVEEDYLSESTESKSPAELSLRNSSSLSSKSVLSIARAALNINYIVILFCLANTPLSIMALVYSSCRDDNNYCDTFLLLYKVMIVVRILAFFGGTFIFFYKIKKYDEEWK